MVLRSAPARAAPAHSKPALAGVVFGFANAPTDHAYHLRSFTSTSTVHDYVMTGTLGLRYIRDISA